MIFFTYNDSVNGIYESQVIDVCRFFSGALNIQTTLLASFPNKIAQSESAKLKLKWPEACVHSTRIPLRFFRLNRYFLKKHFAGKGVVISRGVLATRIALDLRDKGYVKKVIYDGRGAVHAEFEEYIQTGTPFTQKIRSYEEQSVNLSDARIAVSNALVEHWREKYKYSSENHVIIPTTLSSSLHSMPIDEKNRLRGRSKLGLDATDVLFVFSGGDGPWQSASLLKFFVERHFSKDPHCKLLLLGTLKVEFGDWENRVIRMNVPPEEVHQYLELADHGLLLRESSVTNKVSSPTKFAEYLYAGLPVILSPGIGDYSDWVKREGLGMIADGSEAVRFEQTSAEIRSKSRKLAEKYFFKEAEMNKAAYLHLLRM